MDTRQPARVADLARRAHTALAQDQLAPAGELLSRLITAISSVFVRYYDV
jgi:hypothetical protein